MTPDQTSIAPETTGTRPPRPNANPAAQRHPAPLANHAPAPDAPAHEEYQPPSQEDGAPVESDAKTLERIARLWGLSEDPAKQSAAFGILNAVAIVSGEAAPLPPVESSAGLEDEVIVEAPELIEGLLRSGEVMLFAADAKMGKTWLGIELAHAVTSGGNWLGCRIMQTGAVAYLNFELQRDTFRTRMKIVCEQRGQVYPDNLYQVHMRGSESTVPDLTGHILKTCTAFGVKLIVIDSLYNTYGSRSENDNTEMGALMREVFAMAKACGASLIALHHYSKSSGMAANDSARASGAHTLHRAPDNLTTVTRLGEEEVKRLGLSPDLIHARVTPSLRSFRDMPSFIISRPVGNWQFNRHDRPLADMIHDAKAARAASKKGPAQSFTVADLCSFMGEREFAPGALYKEAAAHHGVSIDSVKRRRTEAEADGSISKQKGGLLRATFPKSGEGKAASFNEQLRQIASREQADFAAMITEAPTVED